MKIKEHKLSNAVAQMKLQTEACKPRYDYILLCCQYFKIVFTKEQLPPTEIVNHPKSVQLTS